MQALLDEYKVMHSKERFQDFNFMTEKMCSCLSFLDGKQSWEKKNHLSVLNDVRRQLSVA